ncbi:MAG: methyltransferase domain-containing protein [Oscillospiraceae bacterium]|nr:methyltransferase domain-containing protein [Oscillospiraceae bacterium]
MKTNTRKTAYELLRKMEKGAYSSLILNNELKKQSLDERDKAFTTMLFYGVIERRITLDYIIASFTKTKPEQDIAVLLRMGLYQIIYMDSVPESAAVHETVELSPKRAKSFVNAVLRNFLRKNTDCYTGENCVLPLWIKYSCPEWLVKKWQEEYGEQATLQILETSLLPPPQFVVTGKNHVGENCVLPPTQYTQDLSSQQACELLNPQPGETVIDLCAAPGGKSFTIAGLMNNTGRIISCDIHEKKLKLIEQGATRLGISIIEVHKNDARVYNPDFPKADRVLCDVPCSGLGVIRRKPEIKYKPEADFIRLPEIQGEILQTGSRYVKDKGVLMYSTCTLSKRENDDVIENFLKNNRFDLSEKRTVIPSEDGGDGFFTAVMVRK